MRPAQRVDSHVAMRLQQTYSDCLGIEKIESQLYCFYPTSIRVYEHFPQKTMPYISEELIISQGKITQFAVSNQLIALLLDDCKLIVRLRKCWQRVVYDSIINQQATKINYLKIIQNKLVYRTINKQSNSFTYIFIKLNPKTKQISSLIQKQKWKTFNKFDQFIYLKKLGNIQNFYLGLVDNQIRFGTYYKIDNTENLEQFQFGKIKQQNQLNKVHSFCLISLVKNNGQEVESYKNNKCNQKILYLIKILKEEQSGGQNKLVIKYRKFYQEESIAENAEDNTNVKRSQDDKQVQAYTQMMNVLYQINCVKIPEQKQKQQINDQENMTKQNQNSNGKSNVGKISKTVHIILRKNQVYANYTQDNDSIYIATNYRLFKFIISEKQSYIQQIFQFSKNSKLVQVCQNKIYLANYQLCVLTENQLKNMKEIKSQQNQQSYGSCQILNQIKENDNQIQLSDKSEQKKSYKDSYSQTQNDSQMKIDEKIQYKKEGQYKQIKLHNEISIGQNLPMCPDSHDQILQKINKNLLQIQNNFHKDSMKKIQQLVRKQQDRIKIQINKKLQQLVGTTIAKLIAPLVEKNIQQVLQTKLQELNGYMYSLSMQNLLLLKQEAQRNQAKENMLRTQLLKSELHQVSQSKKAVAQMIEICKKRQIQKLLFFEEVKKKFIQIQKKVIILEDKMKTLVDNQQVSQAKIFDEIQIIKIMLKNKESIIQSNRKKSIILQQKEIINEQGQKDKQKNSSSDQNSQSQQQQSQQQQQNSLQSSEVEKNKIIAKKIHIKGLVQPQKLNIYQFPPYNHHPTNYPPHYRPPPYQPNTSYYHHQFAPQYDHKPEYPYPQYPPLSKYISETPEYYPRMYSQNISQKYKYPPHYFKQVYNQDQIEIDQKQACQQKEQKRQKKPKKKEKSKNH